MKTGKNGPGQMDANAREEMRKWRMVHYADLVDWEAIARGGA